MRLMSVRGSLDSPAEGATARAHLEEIVRHVGHLLPAQGPIGVFIHHNTLHAFEHLPFEEAAAEGARIFGCEPFLTESRYRDELQRGRIHESDVDAVLASELGLRAEEPIFGELSRFQLWRRVLLNGVPEIGGPTLAWTLHETDVLAELRPDLPADAREAFEFATAIGSQSEEARCVRDLWAACQRAVARTADARPRDCPRPVRHRDLLLAAFDLDLDDWVHPLLIRVASAYLDQGLADWSMPRRERGMLACFVDLYQHRLARLCRPFGTELRSVVRGEAECSHDAWGSLAASLSALGVPSSEWEAFLTAEALALRGFAGMARQLEVRPDRVPAFPVPARLVDFLATRMLLVRAGLQHAAERIGYRGRLSALREWLSDRLPAHCGPTIDERAWPLLHVAQLCGLDDRSVDALNTTTVAFIEEELGELDGNLRRQILHRAYERRLRHRFFDAITQHRPQKPDSPAYQAIFCIDEREESMRRHLEEVDSAAETFGAAGFFGIAMYFRGATDAHPRPLCPVAVRPRHYVAEVESSGPSRLRERWHRSLGRIGALVDKNVHLGGRHAGRGAVLLSTVGVLWVLPLVLRVIFPWLRRGVARVYGKLNAAPRAHLVLKNNGVEPAPPIGEQTGFTSEQMADIVSSQLLPIGIRDRFARLVLVVGHGSASLNNPHESAHDCGACGGGRGGPNARAFAQMANDPDVRALLAARGLSIPSETWFVAGERNTASSDLDLFDEELAPAHIQPLLERARSSLEEARRREAHERCRRFESAPTWLPQSAALFHVQARSTDIAQPRPEYGHATNAVCVVGRRSRTRGLFLDRRAFLVSYDPEGDRDGALLAGLLAAVVPVVAGVSLEYLFGYIDRVGYGCGTKLPHNVTALVGVMDGAQSDLRTGLPWQMLEIHEPVRLSMVVETRATLLERLLRDNPDLRRLVEHRWIYMAALDPDSGALDEIRSDGMRRYRHERALRTIQSPSLRYYERRRGHLPFVAIRVDDEAGS